MTERYHGFTRGDDYLSESVRGRYPTYGVNHHWGDKGESHLNQIEVRGDAKLRNRIVELLQDHGYITDPPIYMPKNQRRKQPRRTICSNPFTQSTLTKLE